MANYVETSTTTATKIKAMEKADLTTRIMNAMIVEFGEENVAMGRYASGTSFKNALMVRGSTVEVDGEVRPVVSLIDVITKDYVDRAAKTKTFYAFDFDEAAATYLRYLDTKADKFAKSAQAKEEKIAKDRAKREAEMF